MTEKTHHVSDKKKEIAKELQRLMLEYPIIASVNMENLPAPQLQQMREQLRDKIVLTMTKRRIMKHAIEGVKDKKKGIEQLEEHLKGMPALIFTKENPFSLFKTLKKSKTKAPAKAGQIAPSDIKIPKGPTSFMPGPVIGELAQIGVKSGVENGKVAIKEDSIVAKEGDKITDNLAGILTRLDIKPMEVGLNISAVYENGDIFTANVLDIDEDKFKEDLGRAASWAYNLAVYSAYPTKDTINVLITNAFNDAKALGIEQNIIDEGIVDELLNKAERSALSIKSSANIETVEKPKEEAPKKEEPKVEEKPKEEAKPEVKEEVKVEEKPAEEKVEEPKPEVKEAPKEEKPVEKKEEPKPVEEAPKEEPKPEVEEKKEEEKPKEEAKPTEESQAPTPVEKKEEKVLEEEKEIIEEEKKLEKEKLSEVPVEKEVQKAVKEEEEKQLEKERIEKEKELEKIEEEKKEEPKVKEKPKEEAPKKEEPKVEEKPKEEVKDETDKKISEMVAKTKKFNRGEVPSAEKLVDDVKKDIPKKEVKVEEEKKEVKKEEPKKEEKSIPTIQQLQEEKAKKKKEQEKVEELARELVKKGSLRK